jgi:short-subunit dehydrogenase
VPRPIALITGASSGIGLAYARRLAVDGHDLVVVARREDRLRSLAKDLAAHGATTEVLVADLATTDGTSAVEKRCAAGDLALVINNAGVSRYKPFVELEPAAIDELTRLHVVGPTRIARAALAPMVARGSGALINVASLLSLSGTLPPGQLPFRAVYASCKAYLLLLSQQLAHEVGGKGVRVQVVLPGIVATEFHDDMGAARSALPPGMKADDVVTASLSALAAGEVVCIPPLADPAAFEAVGKAQLGVFPSARSTELAARYRT